MNINRRIFVKRTMSISLVANCAYGQEQIELITNINNWMGKWMRRKSLEGRLQISRFVEPIFFLLDSTSWNPKSSQTDLPSVIVPKGFVTDFASIPRAFWSLLRPDGEYAHAAVIHDYLYWAQNVSRREADLIFKKAMEDLDVESKTIDILYASVDLFGAGAWNENANLKKMGEKRILSVFPTDPTERWETWKRKSGVFV